MCCEYEKCYPVCGSLEPFSRQQKKNQLLSLMICAASLCEINYSGPMLWDEMDLS
jgi:hypothetical protein